MKLWQETLAKRWEALRKKGNDLGWHEAGSPRIAELAERHGLEWYASRSQDLVNEFMQHDAHGLLNRIVGFGSKKCLRLIEILEAACGDTNVTGNSQSRDAEAASPLHYEEVLQSWGVPTTFPVHLLPLSTRLMNFCELHGATTLLHLLQLWFEKRETGMLACENIGQRTVNEVHSLASAISQADAQLARQWLPLNDREDGLCLRRALTLAYDTLPEQTLNVLNRRLVHKLTLEESAGQYAITRERVRQYEAAYLRDIRSILEWFSPQHQQMLETWMDHGSWQSILLPLPRPESETLILAGIEALFEDSPQGLARRLEDELSEQTRMEKIWNHPDLHLGGVDLQTFLDETVPETQHAHFITRLCEVRGLVIDHGSGLIKPASPCVRDTVGAILAQEVEAIPLTWLAMRVQSVEGCEEGDADFILRNRYRWSQLGFLNLEKVIWDQ